MLYNTHADLEDIMTGNNDLNKLAHQMRYNKNGILYNGTTYKFSSDPEGCFQRAKQVLQ